MKKIIIYMCLLSAAYSWSGCEKTDYPKGTVSPYIPILDLRSLYKGADVTLNKENMYGSDKVSGIVVSDHSGGNMPAGLLVIQDKKRLSVLRGIAIPIGADAAKYVPGDSVSVTIDGAILKRVDGILEVTGVAATAVAKLGSGKAIAPNRVPSSYILANPDQYESTLVVLVKGGFDPLPAPTDVLSGNVVVNDGFDNLTVHTDPKASFAKTVRPVSANYYGIVFNTKNEAGNYVPQHYLRTAADVVVLSSVVEIAPIVITGFIADPAGTDANNEYIQLMATKDIDFSVTPYSVVTTNNAGASTPTTLPVNGWATGDLRTYKLNLTSGKAAKGTFFYVGGAGKLINSTSSTSIASANWIKAFNYSTTNGDGFGTKTTNLLANSGNAYGMAVFQGTTVTAATKPVDVVFVATGGLLYSAGPPEVGYRIANTDFYDVVNPITLESQPFYRAGTNTIALTYTTPSDAGYYYMLGGTYNANLGRWIKARTQTILQLTKTSLLADIEGTGATTLK